MNTTVISENRFDDEASRYAEYLETPEGRLRADLTFAGLQDFLPANVRSFRALDLGCGTGGAGVRLARLGVHVTLLDCSPAMLRLAEQAVIEAGLRDNVAIELGDATEVENIFPARSFDLVLCHNVLEFIDDAEGVLRGVVHLMRGPSSMLSLLVRSQAGEVLKAALLGGDLNAAENNLAAEWGRESLYGRKVRYFTPEALDSMLQKASLGTIARRGVRVLSDYLPANISRSADHEKIFALERKLGTRWEFYAVARYLHCLVCCGTPEVERE